MATTTIYARVPEDLKRRLESYARATGKTQTGAVVELLEEGLRTMRDELTLQKRVERLEALILSK